MNKAEVWKSIFSLILPYKKRFFLIVLIGLLSTGANLVEPLIYREAVNDIAGLFVQQAKNETSGETAVEIDESPVTTFFENGFSFGESDSKEPHRKNFVAGRSPEQALQTLLWAAAILFVVNLIKYILWLISDNMNVRLSCTIEQGFIQKTFSHVLKLPIGFFSTRSSAVLAKQINQSEEVSGIVNGFSQQILPELISLSGILVIMFLQNVTPYPRGLGHHPILSITCMEFCQPAGDRVICLLRKVGRSFSPYARRAERNQDGEALRRRKP